MASKLGLTHEEATTRLTQYGPNALSEKPKQPFIIRFLLQFNNFLTILLMFAALLSFLIGEAVDGTLIALIVILNALFGIFQEAKAEQAIAALKNMSVTKIRVIRDGHETEIDSRSLVPGDVMLFEEGTKIPADARLVEERNLEVNEAALTGESLPVAKSEDDAVFMGTLVARGRGKAEVTSTGMQTKFGGIASGLSAINEEETPLQKKLTELSRTIGIVGIALAILVFALSLLRGDTYFPAFLLAISLAVAIVPEGLPAVMTITLSIGVKEMARKRSIIRRLAAIEALGNVTMIVTDKTGTLTTNHMRVKAVYFDGKELVPAPEFTKQATLQKLLLNSILCSTATLVAAEKGDKHEILGDPTEGALLILAHTLGVSPDRVRQEWQLIDEEPFDSKTKQMSVEVKKGAEQFIFVKGAPEVIMGQCRDILEKGKVFPFAGQRKKAGLNVLSHWTEQGLRVIAFAYKTKATAKLVFIGMTAIHDPPRPEVFEALKKTHHAGIDVIMVTGDNERTARAVGVSVGLVTDKADAITGQELAEMTDKELQDALTHTKIFARTTPEDKHRIVKLLQDMGQIVAVTGDGVNDALAIKQANVGVAMGLVGTDVARETADMVIMDDNFATIVTAIEEGRNIINNLKNAIKYLLSCNIGEAIALIVALILGLPHLFVPIQLLYINLVTDGLPALALAFSPRNPHIMLEKPRRVLTLLTSFDRRYIAIVGILTAGLVLGSFMVFNYQGVILGKTAAFSVLALIQSFILIDLWLSHRFILRHPHLLSSPIFLAAEIFPFISQYVLLRSPFLAGIFAITTTSTGLYIAFILCAALILVAIESLKLTILKPRSS